MQHGHHSPDSGNPGWLRLAWRGLSAAQRDTVVIVAVAVSLWLAIERTETCDRLFAWIAANPDYEVDSVILAFLFASIGITIIACRRFAEMRRASTARDEAEQHVHQLAFHDPLTGLPNRRALNARTARLTATGRAQCHALIFIDLDRFKGVNDVHGHSAGDRLLRLVAERMCEELGPGRAIYRLGGDEFAVLIDIAAGQEYAPQAIARRIVVRMAEPFVDLGLVHHIGASAGIAIHPLDADNGEALIRAADVALYRAKQSGRGQFRSFELAMDDQIRERARLELELRKAVSHGGIRPYYQPLVDLRSGRTIGFELLARWDRADGGEIGPDQFIPIAEECGLIGELLLGLLDQACIDARDWDPAMTIAINISPVQFKDPLLSHKILARLARHGFPAQRISIEITENALIADEANARQTIRSLKNQGMRIGLDDFGTGYSSLHHLHILPFDKIKIDKSFISRLGEDAESMKIVKAILGLAASLDLPVLAEGIEDAGVADMLRAMGCAQGQGYLFGRAVPAETVSRVLGASGEPDWLAADPDQPFSDSVLRLIA